MNRRTRETTPKLSEYVKWLDENYQIRAIIESPEGAYKYRATNIGSLLVVVDKIPPDPNAPRVEAWGDNAPKTWEEYAKLIDSIPKRDIRSVNDAKLNSEPIVSTGPEAAGLTQDLLEESFNRPSETDVTRPPTGERPGRNVPESTIGNVERGEARFPEQPGGTQRTINPEELARNRPRVSTEGERPSYSEEYIRRQQTGKASVRDSRSYAEYLGRAATGVDEVVHHHPNIIVETKSLAGVPYPKLEEAYRPTETVTRAMLNRTISLEGNYDPIWAAVQQNDKYHTGILVADDVGVGKSRTAAGFVIDRIEKGRKRILVVTKDKQNVDNLMNSEFPNVYAGMGDENGQYTTKADEFPAKRILVTGDSMPNVKNGQEYIMINRFKVLSYIAFEVPLVFL